MTTGSRPRFSVRVGLSEAPEHDGTFEGVPRHLLVPLQEWVDDALRYQGRPLDDEARAVCLRLRISPGCQGGLSLSSSTFLPLLTKTVDAQLLDVVDEVLRTPTLGE
ncbi:hypothetical protein [Streptomyces sp. NPDC053048]|uniref:hypothetical protein n=1 Tax=Streptomyces sp. NPDC053048 TaxID=3365694 RepID=UPI0037D36941